MPLIRARQVASGAISNPNESAIDSTYSSEEQLVLLTLRSAVIGILEVLRSRGMIRGNLPYTASQSSVYGGLVGTFANLNDGNPGTGAGTNSAAQEWIEADLGVVTAITSVTVGGGTLPNWGGVAGYLNGSSIVVSVDRQDWTPVGTVSGVTDGANETTRIRTLTFTLTNARYVRILRAGWLAITELAIS